MRLEVKELPSGVPLNIIEEKVESGELSEKMGRCGRQGFNMCEVEESDFEQIVEIAKKSDVIPRVRAEKEREIQAYFELNPQSIEDGMRLVENKDEILPDGSGEPDLVCVDKNGNYVVVELKAGDAGYDALGQIISYKSAVRRKTGRIVRGMLIAHNFDPKISFARELRDSDGLPLVEFKKYNIKLELEDY